MITYLYWAAVIGLTAAVLFSVGVKAKKWKAGLIIAILILTSIGKRKKFYPAMPFITAGALLGFLISLFV